MTFRLISLYMGSPLSHIYAIIYGQAKKKMSCFRLPYRPQYFGAYSNFFEDFQDIKVYFQTGFKDFHTFSIQKSFYKKKVCLTTDPKNFGHVTGNKTYFSFGLRCFRDSPDLLIRALAHDVMFCQTETS